MSKRDEKKEVEEGRSLSEVVSDAMKKLIDLSRSRKPADRLRALNIIVFDFLASFLVTHYLIYPTTFYSFGSVVILVLVFAGCLVVGSPLYNVLLEVVANVAQDKKMNALRLGFLILMVILPFGTAGLFLSKPILTNIGTGGIALQLVVIFIGAFVSLPTLGGVDSKTRPELRYLIGDPIFIVTVVSILSNIVLIVMGAL